MKSLIFKEKDISTIVFTNMVLMFNLSNVVYKYSYYELDKVEFKIKLNTLFLLHEALVN